MRTFTFCIIFVFGLLSCDSDPVSKVDDSNLIGEWKLTEAFISAGGPQYWVDVENGTELAFYENNSFSSNRFTECKTGNYVLIENELRLKYSCEDFKPEFVNEDGNITYALELGRDYFILTPTSPPFCTEGCSYKYTRR